MNINTGSAGNLHPLGADTDKAVIFILGLMGDRTVGKVNSYSKYLKPNEHFPLDSPHQSQRGSRTLIGYNQPEKREEPEDVVDMDTEIDLEEIEIFQQPWATMKDIHDSMAELGLSRTERVDVIPSGREVRNLKSRLERIANSVEGPFFKVIGSEGGILSSASGKSKLEFDEGAFTEKVCVGFFEYEGEGSEDGGPAVTVSLGVFPDKYSVKFKLYMLNTGQEGKIRILQDGEIVSRVDHPNSNNEYITIECTQL